uniref:Uncharacterized protein n=1 Tax=Glossina pallidipes TaxID=7398 RepID=A0A1B0A196_GLOPL
MEPMQEPLPLIIILLEHHRGYSYVHPPSGWSQETLSLIIILLEHHHSYSYLTLNPINFFALMKTLIFSHALASERNPQVGPHNINYPKLLYFRNSIKRMNVTLHAVIGPNHGKTMCTKKDNCCSNPSLLLLILVYLDGSRSLLHGDFRWSPLKLLPSFRSISAIQRSTEQHYVPASKRGCIYRCLHSLPSDMNGLNIEWNAESQTLFLKFLLQCLFLLTTNKFGLFVPFYDLLLLASFIC